MFVLITGGSGSGKSEYAEGLALKLEPGKKLYLATMMVWDEEGRKRVSRHKKMREGKRFETVEIYSDLEKFTIPDGFKGKRPTILLECMSNLVCNEFYRQEKEAYCRIVRGIERLLSCSEHLIVVTSEVCSDGAAYSDETERYRKLLGQINCYLAGRAGLVAEAVCGIPVFWKQDRAAAEKR